MALDHPPLVLQNLTSNCSDYHHLHKDLDLRHWTWQKLDNHLANQSNNHLENQFNNHFHLPFLTLNEPSTLGISLPFLLDENLSFRKSAQTKSPGSNTFLFWCLFAWVEWVELILSILPQIRSYSFLISSTLWSASALSVWSKGLGTKSSGPKGSMPYTTLKGDIPVILLGTLLWANSACGSSKSHALEWSLIKALWRAPRVRVVTSAWPSV